MSDSHFITTPIGYVLKDDTLYVVTGKKEHDLDDARQIAAESLSVTADAVSATPPPAMPPLIKVLVMKSPAKAPDPAAAESEQLKTVLTARKSAREQFDKSGFRAAFKPNTAHADLPTSKPPSMTAGLPSTPKA